MLKEELAEIVQHLTDAQAEINSLLRISGVSSSLYHQSREEAVLLARKLWFNSDRFPLVNGGYKISNYHLMKKDKDNDKKKECTEPVWPGECPAPKPGTVTIDPKTGETVIVPLVR